MTHWIGRIGVSVDADGAGPNAPVERWTVYDGLNPYADFDGSGSLEMRYLYGPDVDMIMARLDAAGEVAWYLTDHLGSVRDLTDLQGNVVDHLAYSSFGEVLSESNAAVGDRFRFTGRELDSVASQYHYRYRQYDPSTGRFLSEDPLSFGAGDVNTYRYVENSPGVFRDPRGLERGLSPNEYHLYLLMYDSLGIVARDKLEAILKNLDLYDIDSEAAKAHPDYRAANHAINYRGYAAITLGEDIFFKHLPDPGSQAPLVGHEIYHAVERYAEGFVRYYLTYAIDALKSRGHGDHAEENRARSAEYAVKVVMEKYPEIKDVAYMIEDIYSGSGVREDIRDAYLDYQRFQARKQQ